MSSILFATNAGKVAQASKQAIDLSNTLRDRNREIERAAAEGDFGKVTELEQKNRDSQAETVKAVGGLVLEGEDKQRFDLAIEIGRLTRDRIASGKGFPDWEDLTQDPDGKRTPLQVLESNFGQLGGIAEAAGIGKEFRALDAGLQVAAVIDHYGLGEGKFTDFLGKPEQLKELEELLKKGELSSLQLGQAGIALENLQAGLGMFAALGGYFGFGKDIAKIQQAVKSLQNLQKALNGDIAGGIESLLSLDGLLFDLPPEAKEALQQAKKLAEGLKKFEKSTSTTGGPAGVYVEGKHIAALGLSGTLHGMPLSPGFGSPTVSVYGFPVWRTKVDKHMCSLPGVGGAPHTPPPGVPVLMGALKTKANDQLLARHGDSVVEPNGGGPVQIVPLPEALAIAIKRAKEEAERKQKEEERKAAEKKAREKAAAAKRRGPLTREERQQRKEELQSRRDREARAEARNAKAAETPPIASTPPNPAVPPTAVEKAWNETVRYSNACFNGGVAGGLVGAATGAAAGLPTLTPPVILTGAGLGLVYGAGRGCLMGMAGRGMGDLAVSLGAPADVGNNIGPAFSAAFSAPGDVAESVGESVVEQSIFGQGDQS